MMFEMFSARNICLLTVSFDFYFTSFKNDDIQSAAAYPLTESETNAKSLHTASNPFSYHSRY